VAHDAFAGEDGNDGGGCGVEGEDEAVSAWTMILIKRHDGVDAVRDGRDGILLEQKFRGY
jgi:hypothetical protein